MFSGFTLVELLVALVIVSIVSILLMRALTSFILLKEKSEDITNHLDRVARVFSLLRFDITQAIPVSRGQIVSIDDLFLGQKPSTQGTYWLSCVRMWPAQLGESVPPERISYSLVGEKLVRSYRKLFEHSDHSDVLLEGVVSLKVLFFDGHQKKWCFQWPCLTKGYQLTPEAVSIDLLMRDNSHVHQIFLLP